MNIWRIHLKSVSQAGIDQRQLCLDKGIVGVGWQIHHEAVSVSWDDYWRKAESKYGSSSWKAALNAVKNRIQVNDLIWTRDWYGNYFLGRILSDWYYDTTNICSEADIVNVRKCEWYKIGTEEAVPGKIINSFRPARTVQVINDDTANCFSRIVFNQITGKSFYEVDNLAGKDIFSLLSSDGCEDALAIYLQVTKDYHIIPSSCKDGTMTYEFELKHRQTGKSAVVQVKSGWTPINIDDYYKLDTDIYLFATSGKYYGTPKSNIKTVDADILRKWLYEQTHLLPGKMKVWIELTR